RAGLLCGGLVPGRGVGTRQSPAFLSRRKPCCEACRTDPSVQKQDAEGGVRWLTLTGGTRRTGQGRSARSCPTRFRLGPACRPKPIGSPATRNPSLQQNRKFGPQGPKSKLGK